MPERQATKPVALLVFNRPDCTEKTFAAVAAARPPTLLVVGDGPRPERPGEAERVDAVRVIVERVDWPCEVLTNFSPQNMGCRARVSSGIDWVFEQVPEAIILEDDCLPHPDFFRFCSELLDRYRDDRRVGQISGSNLHSGMARPEYSYYFSRYIHIWGWASWRDRWQQAYDVTLSRWPELRARGWVHDLFPRRREARYWEKMFEEVHAGRVDTWDYQWTAACWQNDWLAAVPAGNLISNIGFRPDATHTTTSGGFGNLAVGKLASPLCHPRTVAQDARFDAREFRWIFTVPPLRKLVRKIRGIARSRR